MSTLKAVARDVVAIIVTTALAIIFEHYVSVGLACITVLVGCFVLVWLHELHKPIRCTLDKWADGLVSFGKRRPVFSFWIVTASGAAFGAILFGTAWLYGTHKRLPLPVTSTTHEPSAENHGITDTATAQPEHYGATDNATTKKTQSKPQSEPATTVIVSPASQGNLKERAINLSNEIMDDLTRHGWNNPEKLPVNDQEKLQQWIKIRSAKFYVRYLPRVIEIRDEFAQLHLRDDLLDLLVDSAKTSEAVHSPVPILPQEIQMIAKELAALASKL